ncbi:hypothetical protein PtB15_4B147 [Puccinia triticina]|nr:hypothetical protein PtB15_4B147 [Puccinia triticina]
MPGTGAANKPKIPVRPPNKTSKPNPHPIPKFYQSACLVTPLTLCFSLKFI